MFVRVKRVKGQDYGYLVENTWTGSGTRQKVMAYLGKILKPARVKSEGLGGFLKLDSVGEYIRKSEYREAVKALVRLELYNHAVDDKIAADFENFMVTKGGRNVVLALNEGFLCGHSLKRALEYVPDEDYSGFLLADVLTGAGIKVEKDAFVALFEKLQGREAEKKAEGMDFYY
ncbi:hypothetical protein JXB11_04870 [Candidatus Woesearchaeota archaeon]|nr:hypothetical protein [Candidatus Woesearchaeota archaeon]